MLVGQLGHPGLLSGGVTAVARAHDEVDARILHELILLLGGMLRIRRPKSRDHDLIIEVVLLFHHVDGTSQGLAPRLGGDRGLTHGLSREGTVGGDLHDPCVGRGPRHRGGGVLYLDLVGLPHVQLQIRLLQGGVGGEDGQGQGGQQSRDQHQSRQAEGQFLFHRRSPFGDWSMGLLYQLKERLSRRIDGSRGFLMNCTVGRKENCEKSPSPEGEGLEKAI